MIEPEESEVQRLEALAGEERDGSAFPALAEAHRRAGDAERAAEVARRGLAEAPDTPAGRVALALALLDLGREKEAREALEQVLGRVADHPVAVAALAGLPAAQPELAASSVAEPPSQAHPLGAFGDDDIDAAFDDAESQAEEMVSANSVAERALRSVDPDPPEGLDAVDPALPVASRTLAGLLERQGHTAEAERMRAELDTGAAPVDPDRGSPVDPDRGSPVDPDRGSPVDPDRGRILATLERWLDNLRRSQP